MPSETLKQRGPAGGSKAPIEPVHKKKSSGLWPDGLAGIRSAGVFGVSPVWVNEAQAPGTTSQTEVLGFKATLKSTLSLKYFFMSPNLVWVLMAVAMHVACPYDIEAAAAGYSLGVALRRFALNFAVAFSYYTYFYVGLYWLGWSDRKFRPGVHPTFGNMLHDLWYWTLAVVQWTLWECVMMRLWATGKVPYLTDEQVFSSWENIAVNAAWVMIVPIWRDLHFYIAHRFIHIRAVYKYVHSLHHRNSDPEPFSGMCMHPVEHLYYFSNAFTPCLYLGLSPFIFLWTYVHLTIAPGAGHSGWEDHFQSDQYHYTHHAKFECNYGSPYTGFIDQFFGTFREAIGESKEYKGQWSEKEVTKQGVSESIPAAAGVWSPQGYLGLPASFTHAVYTLFWVGLFPLTYWAFVLNHGADRVSEVGGVEIGPLMGFTVAYLPVFLAMFLCTASGDGMSWRWPFQKEKYFGAFGFFLVAGWLSCLLPVYLATKWASE